MKKFKFIALMLVVIVVMVGCATKEEAPATKAPTAESSFPERAIEFVACYGPGGGHDTMLRTMQKVIQDNNLIDETINVVNKEGGSGAVGMGYTKGHEGDGHYLMSATNSFITTPLSSQVDVNYKDFTPIARLAVEPTIVISNSKTGFLTLEDIKAAGADKVLNCGGTGTGSIEQVVTQQLANELGIELNYIPFQGDGEVIAALLGQQIDLAATNPNTSIDYINTGEFVCFGISLLERSPALPDVATFVEQDVNITSTLFRGVVAPAGISQEAIDYYVELLVKMTETEQWKEGYIKANALEEGLLIGDDFAEYLDEMNETYSVILKDLGIIE